MHQHQIGQGMKLFLSELGKALRSPTFWLSCLLRPLVLTLGASFVVKWTTASQSLSLIESLKLLLREPAFYIVWILASGLGRPIDDKDVSFWDLLRVFANQIFVPSKAVCFWSVIAVFCSGVGLQSHAKFIAILTFGLYVLRIIDCESQKVLDSLTPKARKRGFATFDGEFPPQTR